ncbi:MAG: hypothetical protein IKW53_07235 [Clostridia bacterium]|nr:hypothetical protein [Clostridia bacterium]
MNKVIIYVGTMTYAIKLRKMLARAGIESRQVKSLDNDGCTHGVEIIYRDFYGAIAILRESGMEYRVENR